MNFPRPGVWLTVQNRDTIPTYVLDGVYPKHAQLWQISRSHTFGWLHGFVFTRNEK